MSDSTYRVISADRSICPDCGRRPDLLYDNGGGGRREGPAFYICTCGFIGQVGVGPVRKSETGPKDLYDVAKHICHAYGLPWTDPRTGVTHPPPERRRT